MEPDLLGTDRPDRPRVRLVWRLAVPLVVVVALLVVADGAVRRAEVDRLLQRVSTGEASATYADRRLSATVEYTGGQMTSPTASPQVRASLRQLVQGEAVGQLPALRASEAAARSVRVLPWHRDVRRARSAAVALLAARVLRLTEVAGDLRRLYQRLPEPAASELTARRALAEVAAAPRVEAAFAPRPAG